ncbi:MAG: sigma 54-interacting transcriptional regulator [Candidatus Acidiferrum sp.]
MGCVSRSSPLVPTSNMELPPDEIVFGNSPAGEAVRLSAEMATTTHVPVLLQGQSGTGKEILARYIHAHSSWGNGAFVKVNCPAIPGTLLESELFGYQKGAFTGAYASKPGRVELADRGTLFLDEIAELDLALQAKLLQLLQDGQFCRIGAQQERRVEVRVVCATNRQLEKEIRSGTFRQDLFYRINVLTIELPPLQQRGCDIRTLANYLLERHGKAMNRPIQPLSEKAIRFLQTYDWPGNIRELETVIKRYVLSGSETVISKSLENHRRNSLVAEIPVNGQISLKDVTRAAIRELEGKLILKTLEAHHWNRSTTARALSISYAALLYKMRAAGLPARGEGRTKNNVSHPTKLGTPTPSEESATRGPLRPNLLV